MPTEGNRRTVKSAERILDLLEVLGRRGGGMTFGMLQSAMQIPKSSLHALLEVATARGYVDFADGTRLYTLGIKAWESSQAYLQQHDLLREARTVMERIAAETRETVQIAKLDGIENIYLAKADSTYPLRLQSEIGTRLLAHATGLGKALLACLPTDEVQSRFAGIRLPRMTANTITDMDKLVEELTATHVRGFGIDNEEYTPGVFCVAVPVRDNSDDAAIAMSISLPVLRTNLGKLAQGLSLLATGSLEISRRAGSTRSDPLLAKLSSPKNAERALLDLAASKRYPLSFTPARDESRSDRRATRPT